MTSVNERPYLSIGEVLGLLLEEFPDITISKIRFLESQGLIEPERTASGYRKFFDADVERLRVILREQRENFLPLRVIRDRLENGEIDDSGVPSPTAPRGIRNVRVGDDTGGLDLDDTGPIEADPTGTISPHADLVNSSRHPAAKFRPQPTGQLPVTAPAATVPAPSPAAPATSPTPPAAPPPAAAAPVPGVPAAAASVASASGTAAPAPTAPLVAAASTAAAPVAPTAPTPSSVPTAAVPAGPATVAPTTVAAAPTPTSPPVLVVVPDHRPPVTAAAEMPSDVYVRAEVCSLAGITAAQLAELESFGLVAGRGTGNSTTYTAGDLAVVRAAAGFLARGIDARHLRGWRQAAEREASLFEQRILPLLRQRNPQARQDAVALLGELADLGAQLREALVGQLLRHHLES